MVRTVASSGTKAVGSKAPRKQFGGSSGGSSSSVLQSQGGGNNSSNFGLSNHAKMWPTPNWQKGIGSFFKKSEKSVQDDDAASTSSGGSDRLETEDLVITSSTMGDCGGSTSSSSSSGSGSGGAGRVYSDDEDKENIDPSSSPEEENKCSRSESGSPSPKISRRKANGKEKAGRPAKRKKRMVLQEDSDYEVDEDMDQQ